MGKQIYSQILSIYWKIE